MQQQQQPASPTSGRQSGGVSFDSILASLALVPALSELEGPARQTLAANVQPIDFDPGEVVVAEGDAADCMYIVHHGTATAEIGGAVVASCELTCHPPSRCPDTVPTVAESIDTRHTADEAGNYFGELGLINDAPRAGESTADSICCRGCGFGILLAYCVPAVDRFDLPMIAATVRAGAGVGACCLRVGGSHLRGLKAHHQCRKVTKSPHCEA